MPPRKLTEAQELEVCRLYTEDGCSSYQIAGMFGIHPSTVRDILARHGLACRPCGNPRGNPRYTVDETYFDAIDTPAKAYWLGFLYADGCIAYHKLKRQWYVALALCSEDEEHIVKFCSAIGYSGPLSWRIVKPSGDKQPRVHVCNKKLAQALERHGCVQRKSLVLRFPDTVPECFLNHFVRGYFDGDGSLYEEKNGTWSWKLASGSHAFLESIQDRLRRACGVGNPKICKDRKYTAWYLRYAGNCQVERILDWLYAGSTPETRLDRKYDLYLQFKSSRQWNDGKRAEFEDRALFDSAFAA